LTDPTGGTFDAAGDFDRLLGANPDRPFRSLFLPDDEVTLTPDQCALLVNDLTYLQPMAKPGPERRGLERLRVLAEICRDGPGTALLVCGD